MVQSWYYMVILGQMHGIYMVSQSTFVLEKPMVVLIDTFLEML